MHAVNSLEYQFKDSVLVQQLCLFKYPFYGQYRILQLDYISLALRDCNAQ